MEAIQSWVSEHKLSSIGALWAFGIGESLVAFSRTKSPMMPSLRFIHARFRRDTKKLLVICHLFLRVHHLNKLSGPNSSMPNLDRMHAQQALTLAVLSGAAAYHYYVNRDVESKPVAEIPASNAIHLLEWELHTPF